MIIWMVITSDLWESLRLHGRLTMRTLDDVARYEPSMRQDIAFFKQMTHEGMGENLCVTDPYHWMATQMQERLTGQHGEWAYPWMAYQQFARRMARPDMRTIRHWWSPEERQKQHLLLRLDMPANQILLYDDEAWVMGPLNQRAVTLSEAERDRFYQVVNGDCDAIHETWGRIYDLEFLQRFGDPNWANFGERIMASFITLDIDYVKSVKRYPKREIALLQKVSEHRRAL